MNTCVLGQQWLKTEILGTVFNDLLASFDLKQWVTTPTHASGHTLDLIITRNQCGVLGDIRVVDPLIFDHCTIFMSLLVHKPHLQRNTIRYRKLRTIDYEEFNITRGKSPLFDEDLDSMVDLNHSVLKFTLNAYAPEKKHLVVHRPCAPWYSDDFSVQKNIKRKLERKWRSSKLPVDRERYVFQNSVVNNMIVSAKQDYYSTKIQENSGNTGILFKTVEKLLNSNLAQRFRSGTDNFSESFVDFFANKIVSIRNYVDTFSRIPNDSPVTPCSTKTESCFTCLFFSEFRLVDEEAISGYVNNLCTKSCALDPIPSSVFQRCQHRLVPIIIRIVNLTL